MQVLRFCLVSGQFPSIGGMDWKHVQEPNGKGKDQADLSQRRQLQPQQARDGQAQHHQVGQEVEDAVDAKHQLLAAAVAARDVQVPVALDGVADEQGAHDARDGQQGDADAGDLGDGRQARGREDLDVEDEQRHLGEADAERPEDLERHGYLTVDDVCQLCQSASPAWDRKTYDVVLHDDHLAKLSNDI